MTQSQNQKITIVDNLSQNICKLRFLSEAVACWDENMSDFKQDYRVGYGILMEDTIQELEQNKSKLEQIEC